MTSLRMWRCIVLLLASLSICLAATPTSFCKCTCFTNSTIIALDEPSKVGTISGDGSVKKKSCLDCNKQFCLEYNLPICKDAKEADVFTQCFQRDSRRDEAVVFIFLFITAGLLTWAAAKPWVEKWQKSRTPQQAYAPIQIEDDSNVR